MRQDIILLVCIVASLLGTIVTIWILWAFRAFGRDDRNRYINYIVDGADMLALIYFPTKKKVEFVSDSVSWLFGIEKKEVYRNVKYLFEEMNLPMGDRIIENFCKVELLLSDSKEYEVVSGKDQSIRKIRMKTSPCGKGRYLLTIVDWTMQYEMSATLRAALDAFEHERADKQRLVSFINEKMQQTENEVAVIYEEFFGMINEVVEAGSPLNISAFSINQLVQEMTNAVLFQAQGRKQKFKLNLSVTSEMVFGDIARLRLAIWNILKNAISYTPRGGTVALTVKESERKETAGKEDRIEICIIVEDTGIGIGKSFMPKLFQPFEREDDPRVRRVRGNGLGLLVVKTIVELMGGRMEVQSEKEHGTCFTLYLEMGVEK